MEHDGIAVDAVEAFEQHSVAGIDSFQPRANLARVLFPMVSRYCDARLASENCFGSSAESVHLVALEVGFEVGKREFALAAEMIDGLSVHGSSRVLRSHFRGNPDSCQVSLSRLFRQGAGHDFDIGNIGKSAPQGFDKIWKRLEGVNLAAGDRGSKTQRPLSAEPQSNTTSPGSTWVCGIW